MTKKRDKIERRRQVRKTRSGNRRPSASRFSGPTPPTKPKEEGTKTSDLLIAIGIVVAIVALFVAVYYFAVRNPMQRTSTPPAETTPSEGEAVATSWTEPPPMAIDVSKDYRAVLQTEKGDIVIDLFEQQAPRTVNNFVFLARSGFYDGVTFHRVLPNFMAQTGDPTGTGSGGPGYTFEDEFHPELRHDRAGIVSMANAGANTNGSQFFITYVPTPHLDDAHSVFGEVIEGMDVVESLTPRNPLENPNAPAGDRILGIEIVES
jgi:cyclophilin family peptidyl-prolyl cis-trans isomerase